MYKYKRGINDIEKAKQIEYTLSDNKDTCLSMSGALDAKKPYNGMYIQNGKIMLENLIEEIEIKDKVYKVTQLLTSVQNISSDEYITSIDLNENLFEYSCGNLVYTKRLTFEEGQDILCIEYFVKNNDTKLARFKIIPMVTYRDLYSMKKVTSLRFNQRKVQKGVIVNLSVMDQANIVIKSKEMEWTKEHINLTNVGHEYIQENLVKQIYTEDVLLPGKFEIVIKPKEEKKFKLYISSKEFEIQNVENENLFGEFLNKKEQLTKKIDVEYVELKDLAMSIDNIDMKGNLIVSLPYKRIYDENWIESIVTSSANSIILDLQELIQIIRAIDGQYLILGKVKEAMSTLLKVRRYIKTIEDIELEDLELLKELTLLKLWYVESVNRLLQSDKCDSIFLDFVKDIVYFMLKEENIKKYFVDIEFVSLTYNAIKIYENMLSRINKEDGITYKASIYVQKLIEENFWREDKRILKKNLKETKSEACIEMIYALSLSFPCIVGQLPVKLLDTIFKELYTPYGLRIVSKNSDRSKGLIYPKYMSHFVKANLRQNGVTRASQKIAYNLVKELVQDIGKYVNGGVKKVYNEKGIAIDSIGYDLLTNAEVIRLYDMLT
ncbi:MAG: glycogen debranching enzyme N-terminal domain-containing protein [Clostridia bacterium]